MTVSIFPGKEMRLSDPNVEGPVRAVRPIRKLGDTHCGGWKNDLGTHQRTGGPDGGPAGMGTMKAHRQRRAGSERCPGFKWAGPGDWWQVGVREKCPQDPSGWWAGGFGCHPTQLHTCRGAMGARGGTFGGRPPADSCSPFVSRYLPHLLLLGTLQEHES